MEYPDVMVDIETTGTDPEHAAIIQIAAVRFNMREKTVDASSMFDRCLAVAPDRFWSEDTRSWWHGKNLPVLRQIQNRMEDPGLVMQAFQDWAGNSPSVPHRFWAKPTSFDYSFVASYFRQYGMHNPFHFRYARDVNSYLCGMARDPDVQKVDVDFAGDVHNALHDVLHQIKTLFAAEEQIGV